MHNAHLENWKPTPHSLHFAHLASTPSGSGVGLALVRVNTGRRPCRGIDRDPHDGYEGDLCADDSGLPYSGLKVQYCRAGQNEIAAETETDARGAHCVWLPPGDYVYRYLIPLETDGSGYATEDIPITVVSGFQVMWEEAGAEGEPGSLQHREVAFMQEDLVLDWNTHDGQPFQWPDIEETIVRVATRINSTEGSELSQLSMIIGGPHGFARPDILFSLQRRGINAIDCAWRDMQLACAYRNFSSLTRARAIGVVRHDRARYQVERGVILDGRSVKSVDGIDKYLADCRAAAFYFASQIAAFAAPGDIEGQEGIPGDRPLRLMDVLPPIPNSGWDTNGWTG